MTLIKAENRELTHSRYQSTKGIPTVKIRRPTARGYYLALTFGTLLSSQGADAQQSGPRGLSSLADCPTIHRTRMFPAPGSDPVPSRAGAVHGEQYTKLSGPAGALPPVLLCPTWSTTRARRQTSRSPSGRGHNAAVARALPAPCDQRHGENPEEPQATPRGRNWT